MALEIYKTVPLDVCNNCIKSINVKQYDTKSRFVEIPCTEDGNKILLDSSTTSAFVGYKKPDGNYVLNDCIISDFGTVILELSQQMLAVSGKSKLDIILVEATGIKTENLSGISDFSDLGVAILSTMYLEVNVLPSVIGDSKIESTYEYNALLNGIATLAATEKKMDELENELNTNESIRLNSEESRQSAESAREYAENLREQNTSLAISNCETATENANTATQNCNDATENANNAIQNCNNVIDEANIAINNCNTATKNANDAAELCQSVIDGSGIVLQSEKGVANGVATLNENAKVPNSQLDIANNLETSESGKLLDASQAYQLKSLIDSLTFQLNSLTYRIDELELKINNLPTITYGTSDPIDSVGKTGDIYLKLLSNETVTSDELTNDESTT